MSQAPTPQPEASIPPAWWLRAIYTVEQWICFVLLAVLCVVVFLAVIFRTILGEPLPWSMELARYLFVWLCWLGAAVGVGREAHFGIDAVVKRLPRSARLATRGVVFVVIAVFLVILIVYGFKMARLNWVQRSPAMGLRLTFAYAAVPIGGVLMLFHWIEANLRRLRAVWGGDS